MFVICTCVDEGCFANLYLYLRSFYDNYKFVSKLKESTEMPQDATTACVCTYKWANFILIARDAISCDQNTLPVKYEDILARSEAVVRQIFEKLETDTAHIGFVVYTCNLSRDSQSWRCVNNRQNKS